MATCIILLISLTAVTRSIQTINVYGSIFAQIKLPFDITYRSTFAAGQFAGSYSVFSGSQVGGAAAPRPTTSLFQENIAVTTGTGITTQPGPKG